MTCQARRQQDQMACARCGLLWDVDDDDPPDCLSVAQIERGKIKRQLDDNAEKQETT